MSSSNYQRNKAACDQFRRELMAMMDDISEINRKVLNKSVNQGVVFAKRNTPVGVHPNPVTFTVRHGKHAGKEVSFNVKNPGTGGKLKESWHKLPTKKSVGGVEAEVVNTQFYASYWNDGHRIVTKKGGPIKGFVKGTHVLEKMKSRIDHQMVKNFEAEVKAVQAKHDN
ncbi:MULTISPECIES: HK97 gp10 family phage protein [Eisenbergiella]|nr:MULTISPECIES: HK97 gp10 family phage protein [Eisenbergiella]